MNYLFGKLKQKLNKTATQQISNVKQIIQTFQISTKQFQCQQIDRRIQSICQNCNKWGIYIINQPSMGLYFCQTHNRRCIQQKSNFIANNKKQIAKKQILLKQVVKTNEEVKQVGDLSNQWFMRIVSKLDQLQKIIQEEKQAQQIKQNPLTQNQSQKQIKSKVQIQRLNKNKNQTEVK